MINNKIRFHDSAAYLAVFPLFSVVIPKSQKNFRREFRKTISLAEAISDLYE